MYFNKIQNKQNKKKTEIFESNWKSKIKKNIILPKTDYIYIPYKDHYSNQIKINSIQFIF